MTLAPITDMTAQGLALLIPEYQETPRWQAWIASFLDATQDLDTATTDVYAAALDLDGAVGAQLDLVGQLVVEDRDGRSDDDYRRALKVRVLINKSQGTAEQLIQIAALFADVAGEAGASVKLQELQPAGVEVRILRTPVAARGQTAKRLRNAKAAGVALQTLLHPGGPGGSFAFSDVATYPEKSTVKGFARTDLTDGGKLGDIYVSGGLPFSPSGVPGLVLDLDGDVGVTIATGVSTWADQSGGTAHDAAQATAAKQPTYAASDATFNGHGSVAFDGVDDFLTIPNHTDFELGSGITIYVVMSASAPGASVRLIAKRATSAATSSWLSTLLSSGKIAFATRNAANSANYSSTSVDVIADGSAQVFRGRHEAGVDTGVRVSGGSEVVKVAADEVASSTGTVNIGCLNTGGTSYYPGKIARVLIYSASVSSTDDARVMAYLNARYGI